MAYNPAHVMCLFYVSFIKKSIRDLILYAYISDFDTENLPLKFGNNFSSMFNFSQPKKKNKIGCELI